MTTAEETFWQKVKTFELDDPESAFTFTDRLARENRWEIEFSVRVILEYKKFMFLLCIADHPLTPSDQIDQAWHLHLIYTHSYWIEFCQNTLAKNIHHGPTKGGKHEADKFTDWYEKTKQLYINIFGKDPPSDIWPSSKVRFSEINFQRINRDKYWIIKKP